MFRFRFFIKKEQLINIQQRKKNYRINKFKREIEMNENGCRDCPKSRRKKERHKTCYGHTCELLSVLDFSFSRINRILWSFSGLHCVIIFVCSSLFLVVVVRLHPRMNVSYLMSVIFNVSICRQPEIIKLTGNFWCVNKFSLKTYRVTQFTSLRSQNWSVLTISLESPWNDCGSCEFTTILVKTRTRKTMKRKVNIIKRSRKEREICRQHEWDLLFNH